MGKSYKKAIIKDKTNTKVYRRNIRGSQNTFIRSNMDKILNGEDIVIPDQKEIINDYDYSDWKFDYEHIGNADRGWTEEDERKRLKRK